MSSDFGADEVFIQVKIKATRKSISSSVPKNTGIGELVIKEALVYSGLLENFEQKKAITNETIKSIVFMPLSTKKSGQVLSIWEARTLNDIMQVMSQIF